MERFATDPRRCAGRNYGQSQQLYNSPIFCGAARALRQVNTKKRRLRNSRRALQFLNVRQACDEMFVVLSGPI
jgi:hypothetical protein